MIAVERARSLLLKDSQPLPTQWAEVHADSSLDPLLRRRPVLAETLHARWSLPSDPTSIMDGFAVRSAELIEGSILLRQGESAAGHPSEVDLQSGHAMPISTGAVLPEGADMVVPIEDCRFEEGAGSTKVIIAQDAVDNAKPGRFVRAAGSDILADRVLLEGGAVLGPGELALLVAGGHAKIPVHRSPRVAIIATGDELLAPGSTPSRGQLIETNAMMLAQMCREAGAEVTRVSRAADRPEDTRAALEAALDADVILTSGGISVGEHDLVLPALESLGFEAVFRKLRLRPGKPTTFGHVGDCRVLALPGNPASSYVAFELFARPLLRRLGGYRQLERPRLRVRLATAMSADERRDHYARARLVGGRAQALPTQLSGALTSLAAAELLVVLPAGSGEHPVDSEVDALLLAGHEVSR
jgi:molybdopterin molybdotransferase